MTAGVGSSSWTRDTQSLSRSQESFGATNEKPRILSDTGLATGGPPVLQAQPVALIGAGEKSRLYLLDPQYEERVWIVANFFLKGLAVELDRPSGFCSGGDVRKQLYQPIPEWVVSRFAAFWL